MTPDLAIDLTTRMFWTAILIGGPAIGLSLIVGLVISILQVATQVQEMSLTFVPKMLTVALVLIALGGWMLEKLVQFATQVIGGIPTYF